MEESQIKEILKTSQRDVRSVYSHLDEKISRTKIEILSASERPVISSDPRIREEINGLKKTIENLERDLRKQEKVNSMQFDAMDLMLDLVDIVRGIQFVQSSICNLSTMIYTAMRFPDNKFDAKIPVLEQSVVDDSKKLDARIKEWNRKWGDARMS